METFPRPRYLLGFSREINEELTRQVKDWLLEAGLQIDLDGRQTPTPAALPFLVVSCGRCELEAEAERLGYLKAHLALKPFVEDQGYGKVEFERRPEEWLKCYEDYESDHFWLPCERIQLLRHRMDGVPAPQMKSLQIRHSTALAVADRLLPALRIAGLIDCMVPLDDDFGRAERRAMWKDAMWMLLSPSDRIQHYFGSEVALYFAWLNHFTLWLLAPAAVGVLCFLRMRLSGCTVDDDPYLPFYSLFVVFWGFAFLRSWDRHSSAEAWRWNAHGVESRPWHEHRSEFMGELRTSRVTGLPERYYPESQRLFAYILSVLVTSVMLAISFCVMICSLNLQGYMEESATSFEQVFYIAPLARLADAGAIFDPDQTEYFGLVAFGPVVLHVLAIMALNKLYGSVAEWLTEKENHERLDHHQSSLMAKRFMFEAFDCYISLFYVGFVQQDIRKLRQELICLYGVDSLRRVFVESILPLVLEQISKRRLSRKALELKRSDQAHFLEALEVLEQPHYEQFDDFLEMVIEFGYVTLFASAFPLAAAMSVLSNLVELKSDTFKLILVYQRPMSRRMNSIGIWRSVLHLIAAMSIVTNVMIFVMSEQLASWAPWLYREASVEDVQQGRLGSVMDTATGTADLVMQQGAGRYVIFAAVVLEHVVGLAVVVMMAAIPCQPDWVRQEIQRSRYFKDKRAKEAEQREMPKSEGDAEYELAPGVAERQQQNVSLPNH